MTNFRLITLFFIISLARIAEAGSWFSNMSLGSPALDPSTLFQINSSTKGSRFCPVMTTAQKNAISSPATSLCVYDSDIGKYSYYASGGWNSFATLAMPETFTNKTLTNPTINAGALNNITSFTYNDPNSNFTLGFNGQTTGPPATANREIDFTLGGDTDREIYLDGNIYVENGDISTNGDLTTTIPFEVSGGGSMTLNTTNTATSVVVPATGTLSTLAGTESLSNKTLVDPQMTSLTFPEISTPSNPAASKHKLYIKDDPFGAELGLFRLNSSGTEQQVGQDVVDIHSADTTSVHGITNTADIATKTGTEIISGKTFSDAITLTEIATPSNPAASKHKIYPKADGKLYKLNSAGTEIEVGSGSGGGSAGINYFSANPGIESATTGFATFADASGTSPVDGTGGSPNVMISRSITTPLRETGDLNFVKDAADRRGQGFSYDVTTYPADQTRTLYGSFEYELVSGTFASGDMTVWAYDITNGGSPIQATNYIIPAGTVGTKLSHQFRFPVPYNTTSLRIIFFVGTTSSSDYTIAFDNFYLGPTPFNIPNPSSMPGNIVLQAKLSGSQSVSSSSSTIVQFNTVSSGKDTASGLNTGTYTYTVQQPGWYFTSVNGTVASVAAGTRAYMVLYKNGSFAIGGESTSNISTDDTGIWVNYLDYLVAGDTLRIEVQSNDTSYTVYGGSLGTTWNIFRLPDGSSPSSIMVGARYIDTTGTQSIANGGGYTAVTFNTKIKDTHGIYSAGVITIPYAGWYDFKAVVRYDASASANNQTIRLRLYNITTSSAVKENFYRRYSGETFAPVNLDGDNYFEAGQQLRFETNHDESSARTLGSSTIEFSFTMKDGSSDTMAPINVSLKYRPSGAQSVPNTGAWTNISFATREWDTTGGSYNGTTFTAPISGQYLFTMTCETSASSSGLRYYAWNVNGVNKGCKGIRNGTPFLSPEQCTGKFRLLAGETVILKGNSDTSTLNFCGSDPDYNSLTIDRVGNY